MGPLSHRWVHLIILTLAALLLAGCPGDETPAATEVAVASTTQPEPQAEVPTTAPTATLVPPSATPEPPTATPEPPTATPKPPTPTSKPATPTPEPPTATPEPPTPTPEPEPETPQAVASRAMNVRGGPGTDFAVIASAKAGDSFDISGKNEDGSWYQVCCFAEEQPGWVSASLVTVEGDAAEIQVATDIPAPPPTPTSPPQPTNPPSAPPSAATATPESELPPDLGCYLIQNQINAELTFTIEAVGWNWRETFRIPAGAEVPYCLSPGRYNYTIDAPPPWSNINGSIDVVAGDRLYWPIRGR